MADDPFERAAEEELRKGAPARPPTDEAPRENPDDAPVDWGRSERGTRADAGPPAAARPAGRGPGVPRVPGRAVPKASASARGGWIDPPDAPRTPPPAPDAAEAARRAPDYIGDYPHGVPRWDDRNDGAVPAGSERRAEPMADGTGLPRGAGTGAHSEVGAGPAEGHGSTATGWLAPGVRNVQLCHALNVAAVWLQPLVPLAGFIAFLNRGRVGPELASHYDYALRTVVIGIVLRIGAGVAAVNLGPQIGLALGIAVNAWLVARGLLGLIRAGTGRPMPNPRTWWI